MDELKQEITFDEWEGRTCGENSGGRAESGGLQSVFLNGEHVGFIVQSGFGGYHAEIGKYPNEKYIGEFRTANAARKAAIKELREEAK